MPKSKYDKFFGGKGGANKAHAAMVKQYGDKADEVFYATMEKHKDEMGGKRMMSPNPRRMRGR